MNWSKPFWNAACPRLAKHVALKVHLSVYPYHTVLYLLGMARKNKTDWFRAGLKLLELHGTDGLKVEYLLAELAVTKGSFYHHFASLAEYKTALLDYLEQVGFAGVVQRMDASLSAAEQLDQLTLIISRYDYAEDRILRAWAERDEQAQAFLKRIDQRRIAYLQEKFTEVTGSPERGAFMARLIYAFFLGVVQMQPPIRGEEYIQMMTALQNALLGGESHE